MFALNFNVLCLKLMFLLTFALPIGAIAQSPDKPSFEVKEIYRRSESGVVTEDKVARLLNEDGTIAFEISLGQKQIQLVDGQLPFMFRSKDLRAVELLPYQRDLRKAAELDGLNVMREYLVGELIDGSLPESKRQKVIGELLFIRNAHNVIKEEVLLPHQRSRLEQIKFTRAFRSNFEHTVGALATELKLDDTQRKEMRNISSKMQKEIEQAIKANATEKKELQCKFLSKVSKLLPPESASLFDSIVDQSNKDGK